MRDYDFKSIGIRSELHNSLRDIANHRHIAFCELVRQILQSYVNEEQMKPIIKRDRLWAAINKKWENRDDDVEHKQENKDDEEIEAGGFII